VKRRVAAVLLAAAARLTLGPLTIARLLILGGALGVLVLYDMRERRIPNRIVLPAACVCAALSLAEGVHPTAQLLLSVGVVLGLLCVSLAAPAVLGMGDVKLALLIVCALDAFAVIAFALTLEVYTIIAAILLFRRGRAALRMSLPLAPITTAGCLIALLLL
jgi:leader peptidase (prepilin peptidase) / N-methyltransferase